MKRTRKIAILLAVIALVALPIVACVASVGVSVPIGNPWGGGPYGSVSIGSGPIYF